MKPLGQPVLAIIPMFLDVHLNQNLITKSVIFSKHHPTFIHGDAVICSAGDGRQDGRASICSLLRTLEMHFRSVTSEILLHFADFGLSAGLAPVDDMCNETDFRVLQLEGLIRRIEARQEIRGRYANLLGTVGFFCVYIVLIYLQKGDIEQSSMIQVVYSR